MEDFLSLFLPDLLNNLESLNADGRVKVEDEVSYSREGPRLSGPIGRFRYVGPDNNQQADDATDPQLNYGELSQYLQLPMAPAYTSAVLTPQFGLTNHGISTYKHQQFPDVEYGHKLHYADFIPPESAPQSQYRQRQQHVAGYQPNMAQFDPSYWLSADMHPMQRNGYIAASGLLNNSPMLMPMEMLGDQQWATQRQDWDPRLEKTVVDTQENTRQTKVKAEKAKPSPVLPHICIDYSRDSLCQLLDMTLESSGPKSPIGFEAFLQGRILTNDTDNFNRITVVQGSVDPARTYLPQVISCYRRNFVNMHLKIIIPEPVHACCIMGAQVHAFKIEVDAVMQGKESKTVAINACGNDADSKDGALKHDEYLTVADIQPGQMIPISELRPKNYFIVKKLQFKSATANGTNLNFQTYNRIRTRLVAITNNGEHVLDELLSKPIIVRGRNPSFYHSKQDLLIKPKSPFFGLTQRNLLGANPRASNLTDATELIKTNSLEPLERAEEQFSDDISPPLAESEKFIEPEKDASSENSSDQEENHSPLPLEKSTAVPSGTNLTRLLESMKDENSGKYHYFPILNVYYLPPINVVYFPHGAHHSDSIGEVPPDSDKQDTNKTPGDNTQRKSTSKVYFRS